MRPTHLFRCAVVALAMLLIVVTACKQSPDLDDRPVCSLGASDAHLPWRQVWRFPDMGGDEGGVSLRDDNWIWIATSLGLVRLDSQTSDCTFFEHTGSDPRVSLAGLHTLLLGPQGCLWAAGFDGVARYCAGDRGWQAVLLDHAAYGLAFDAQGNLWTTRAAGRGVPAHFRYSGHEPPSGEVWQGEFVSVGDVPADDCADWFSVSRNFGGYILQSLDGCRALSADLELLDSRLPLTANGASEVVFSDGQTTRRLFLTLADRVPTGPFVVDLAQDEAGRMWAASNDGLLRLDDENWQPTEIGERVLVAPDQQGGLWAVSSAREGGQAHHFVPGGDLEGAQWQHYPGPEPWCPPLSIAADVQGKLWWSSHGCDLQSFDGRQWSPHDTGLDLSHVLLATGPDGLVYAARDDHVLRYDGAAWEALPAPERDFNVPACALTVDRHGGLWIGYSRSPYLNYLDGKQWRQFPDLLSAPACILWADARGHVWVGRDRVLLRYDGENWAEFPGPGDRIMLLAEDSRGRFWVSGFKGFYVYDPSQE